GSGESAGQQPEGVGLGVEGGGETSDLVFGDRRLVDDLVADAGGHQHAHDPGISGTPLGGLADGAGEPVGALVTGGAQLEGEVTGSEVNVAASGASGLDGCHFGVLHTPLSPIYRPCPSPTKARSRRLRVGGGGRW